MTEKVSQIRVVVLKEGDVWVAQCLEYDIGAQAGDMDTLWSRLNTVLAAERLESASRDLSAFEGIPAAPDFYHGLWDKATLVCSPETNSPTSDHAGLRLAMCA